MLEHLGRTRKSDPDTVIAGAILCDVGKLLEPALHFVEPPRS